MRKEELACTLEQQLRALKAERAQGEPALLAARAALKLYQSQRLATSHADLLAAPDTRAAARFFLDEVYGAREAERRDTDLERIIPTMQRVLPLRALQTITEAVLLEALSERLDTGMARVLGSAFTQRDYAEAYRSLTPAAERERQLHLIEALGDSLCELARLPFLSATLLLMRGPARLAGLGDLQAFLEHGFGSFKQMRQPAAFVATIVGRERRVLENLYAGHPQPFQLD